MPGADRKLIDAVVAHAVGTEKYLVAMDAVLERARFFAKREGRTNLKFADVMKATEIVDVSAAALKGALADPNPTSKRSRNPTALPLQPRSGGLEMPPEPTIPARQTIPGETNRLGELETAPG